MQADHSATDKGGDLVEVASEWLLGELTDDPQKDMGPLRPQSLSIPPAFACLLRLAGGKNITLEGTEDLTDVLGRQGRR